MNNDSDDMEAYLYERIREEARKYELAIKPYLDRLARLNANRLPSYERYWEENASKD